ncbi:MAG TPA: 3-phenylpropionate/cinnamic acid dioxygenase subunit beta [Solirubrobacterales bacterium]
MSVRAPEDAQAIANGGAAPLPYSDPAHQAAAQFLVEEAHVLDRRDFATWVEMLAPDIRYRVPVRATAAGMSPDNENQEMGHFDEDHFSLRKRVERFSTEHAWAEDPPSRTRRFVTNFRSFATAAEGEVVVESCLLLYRSRGDALEPALISAARTDRLRGLGGERPQLASRLATVDDSVLRTPNLAVFI